MVKLLIKLGASLRVKNKYGLTPMDIAHALGRKELLKLHEDFTK